MKQQIKLATPTLAELTQWRSSTRVLLDVPCELLDGRSGDFILLENEVFLVVAEEIIFYQTYTSHIDVYLSPLYDTLGFMVSNAFQINVIKKKRAIMHSPAILLSDTNLRMTHALFAYFKVLLARKKEELQFLGEN